MNIFILRHGIAVERGTLGFDNDADRPLLPKGERRLRAAAAAMEKMELSFDLVLSSPFLRARQTAEIIARELKLKKRLQFSDVLTPDGSFKNLVRQLNELHPVPENVLLVGHEPYLSRLISLLISVDENTVLEIKKGGLCQLEADALRAGVCAKLIWLLTPAQMELMG
jgi:phosphohistidine phosphatase